MSAGLGVESLSRAPAPSSCSTGEAAAWRGLGLRTGGPPEVVPAGLNLAIVRTSIPCVFFGFVRGFFAI
eukprot:9467146-Pyramimonas_sp.AAC.1